MMLKMQNYQLTDRYKKEEELFVDTTQTVMQECEVFHAELAQMDLGAKGMGRQHRQLKFPRIF